VETCFPWEGNSFKGYQDFPSSVKSSTDGLANFADTVNSHVHKQWRSKESKSKNNTSFFAAKFLVLFQY